ncbi:alpha-1,4-glucan branching enzyme [Allomyces arbusculus]|nr:alpha-1,4-glucan branching enzyme [Allomyces arbusculus]
MMGATSNKTDSAAPAATATAAAPAPTTAIATMKAAAAAAATATTPAPIRDTEWAFDVVTGPDFPKIVKDDPYLGPYTGAIKARFLHFQSWIQKAERDHGSLRTFARQAWQTHFGFTKKPDGTIVCREYLPGASSVTLIGEFNDWDRSTHKMKSVGFGVWEVELPAGTIKHNTKVKLHIRGQHADQPGFDRISPWARRVIQEPEKSPLYQAVYWDPPTPYTLKYPRPPKPATLRIYEAHVGIASPEPRIATYKEFTRDVLPRIARLGYNAVQLMAVMEHAYYASFGYQVTSFFAPSSRFGTPEELKMLIDEAHRLGLVVLLDLVHSHASKNVLDGLNLLDGTDHCYFHSGPRGWHALWDSRLFNYGHYETLRFLLGNCDYWMHEYGFDGFRFDGVTSMLYQHHGIATGFSGHYDEYFGPNQVDDEAVTYLMLANYLIHQIHPDAITVAEDVSGMPGVCRPVADGGVGFDYRLGMAIPDMWIKMLKEQRDDDWEMGHVVHTLTNRRWNEATIGYAESHDQALVGDKTLAFWLMDADMYFHMSEYASPTAPATIDRGMALHKLIRLVTFALGGEAYLTFMGNEFGHPEWLDFPRVGNGESYHYARRQYPLADDGLLRYRYLAAFDAAMMALDAAYEILGLGATGRMYVSTKHEGDKVVAFERWAKDGKNHAAMYDGMATVVKRSDGSDTYAASNALVPHPGAALTSSHLLFVFNFHPTNSYTDYPVGTDQPGTYRVVLDSDAKVFGGHARVDTSVRHFSKPDPWNGRKHSLKLYLPARSAQVLALEVPEKTVQAAVHAAEKAVEAQAAAAAAAAK